MFWESTILVSCVKILLIPAYHSTDFEVHRNWLALTHTLPVKKWYFENTSEWTLDYPPLFGWFELILSQFAKFFDPRMLDVKALNFQSNQTVLFQRLSVIITDLIYAYGSLKCCNSLREDARSRAFLYVLLIGNIGLLIVDHIHFQYNGILFGILLISISHMLRDNFKQAAFWFAILVCMKHIFLYVAPAYFIYLLRNFCFTETNKNGRVRWKSFAATRFLQLAAIVLGVFTVTFLPFHDHIPQVVSRLFPFKRGLCHAYWAPNTWALYNVVDKFATLIGKKLGFNIKTSSAAMTGGLVAEVSHTVLPNISPLTTLICTCLSLLPILAKLWCIRKDDRNLNFIRALVLCGAVSFLFGWHVHEKAILMLIVPWSILAVNNRDDASFYLILTIVGHYSLLPLLFPENLLLIKFLFLLLHIGFMRIVFTKLYGTQIGRGELLGFYEFVYVLGFVPLFIYSNFVHIFLRLDLRFPFVPLLITSLYCACGVCYVCSKYYVGFLKR